MSAPTATAETDVGTRLARRFAALRAEGRAGLVTFTMAGDPGYDTALSILRALPAAGADILELGMPFSDPVADGPVIQEAAQRALAAGASMKRTLEAVRAFREGDEDTPVVLMGYYNPIHHMGPATFARAAGAAGVDGVIVVDLPAEEAAELVDPLTEAGVAFIRLVAPTTTDARLPLALRDAGGFVYYVSVAGITGAQAASEDAVAAGVARIRNATSLPVAVGFGIKTPEQAASVARAADAVVVGSALVAVIASAAKGNPSGVAEAAADFVHSLATGVRAAR